MSSQSKLGLRVPYALAVHDEKEKENVIKVLDEKRTITGKETKEFEESVAKHFSKKYGVLVNSGSSANILAIDLLNLPEGSEIITPLLTFSTTVAPIVRRKLTPVFVDVEPGTYVINTELIEKMITKKTKAMMIPLLLGNVPNMKKLLQLAKKYNLFFIEDSCDTLGATFDNKPTGSYSDISTTSFYGSHIITAGGGGGMIMVNKKDWRNRLWVLRGWGRSSSRLSESEDVEDRFKVKLDGIPYDAKFIFDEVGYNFLYPEIGAAFGNAQIKKLPKFKNAREKNYNYLYSFFKRYEDLFILPKQDERVSTQWLAFPLTIKKNTTFTRLEIVKYMEENNIQTRPVFTGNILRQPAFKDIIRKTVKNYPVTDEIMERGFVIGCHHGLEKQHLEKITTVISAFLQKNK